MKALALALALTLFPLHVSSEPTEQVDPEAQVIIDEVTALTGEYSDALVQMCGLSVMLITDSDTDYAMVYVGADLGAQLPGAMERAKAGGALTIVDLADAYPPVRAGCIDYHYVHLKGLEMSGADNATLMARALALSTWSTQHPLDPNSTAVLGVIIERHERLLCTEDDPRGTGPEIPVLFRF